MMLASIAFALLASTPSTRETRALAWLANVLADTDIPGIGIAVSVNGSAALAGGVGVASPDGTAVDADTLFMIGSATKTFIAIGLAFFVSRGVVDWDTPVVSILPAFRMSTSSYMSEHVTIGDLLAHRTGLGGYLGDGLWMLGRQGTERSLIEKLAFLEPRHPLGTSSANGGFQYSNMGYAVATVVLEELSGGARWFNFLRAHLWEPVGMLDTYASPRLVPSAAASRLSSGHGWCLLPNGSVSVRAFDLRSLHTPSILEGFADDAFGAGSMVSSPRDLALFSAWLLNGCAPQLHRSTCEALTTGHAIAPASWANPFLRTPLASTTGTAVAAGLGFDLSASVFDGQPFYSKGGDVVLHQIRNGFLPSQGLGVSVLLNAQWPSNNPGGTRYAVGLVEGLLRIYSQEGVSDAELEALWNVTRAQVASRFETLVNLPVQSLSLRLADGGTHQVDYAGGGICYDALAALVAAGDTSGVPATAAQQAWAGVYTHPYYGEVTVSVRSSGQLHLSYERLAECVLTPAARMADGAFLCANVSLRGFLALSAIPDLLTVTLDGETTSISIPVNPPLTFLRTLPPSGDGPPPSPPTNCAASQRAGVVELSVGWFAALVTAASLLGCVCVGGVVAGYGLRRGGGGAQLLRHQTAPSGRGSHGGSSAAREEASGGAGGGGGGVAIVPTSRRSDRI